MANQRVPNISTTSPEVGGTVDSQLSPIATPNNSAEVVLSGTQMNTAIAAARVK